MQSVSRTLHEKSGIVSGHCESLQEYSESKVITALPVSEIEALSEQNQACKLHVTVPKCVKKTKVRRKLLVPLTTKDRKKLHHSSPLKFLGQMRHNVSSNPPVVSEAIVLATSKGLRGGYVEYIRQNTYENIKCSFEQLKKELINKQSFRGGSNSAVRYLQAARILYNRLGWRERRYYELTARYRAQTEQLSERNNKMGSWDHELPLFVNKPKSIEEISGEACVMPLSEYVFMDPRSKEDITRYDAFLSRRIHCPLCPPNKEKLVNTLQYQLHMIEYHSCAHLYACHFCGVVFPSLESLKTHDDCGEFATALFSHMVSSGEVELTMKYAIVLMVCTDCGLQLPISSSFIGESSVKHWDEIIEFHMLHNSEKLVPLIIYSEVELSHKVQLQIRTLSFGVKDFEIVCPYCGITDFESIDSLESHFLTHNECCKRICPVCTKQFCQEAFYREHLLSHLEKKSCYLAVFLSHFCTFFTRGLPSCGPNFRFDTSAVIYGGVSSTIHCNRLRKTLIDPWDSVTVRKEMNRRQRKRKLWPSYAKEPDEIDVDVNSGYDRNCVNLRRILGDTFDREAVLKTNGFFYTALNSENETDYLSKLYNSSEMELECVLGEYEFGNCSKLADDISQKFTKNCELFTRRALSKNCIPTLTGLQSKVFMCQRCHCLCTGEDSMLSHLLRCCPELRKDDNPSVPYDLEDGLLVLCVFAGNTVPNSRIKCWECPSTLCSIFGLRVHMVIHHGTFLGIEEASDTSGFSNDETALPTSTTRSINLALGLTADGSLPVNLEEKRRKALLAKLKLDEGVSSTLSPSMSQTSSLLSKDHSCENVAENFETSSFHDNPPPSVQMLDYIQPSSVQVVEDVDLASPVDAAILRAVGNDSTKEVNTCSLETQNGVSSTNIDLLDKIDASCDSSSASSAADMPPYHCDEIASIQSSESINTSECSAKEPLLCEFCCLTLFSHEDLKEHWRLHIDNHTSCHLCNPPIIIDTAELFLRHIHAAHTSEINSCIQNGEEYETCNFCKFSVRRNRIMAHLLSECYMAPCVLCGNKLSRRNERISHKKCHADVMNRFICECRRGFATFTNFSEHECRVKYVSVVICRTCDAKFTGPSNNRSKILNAGVDHYIEKHTANVYCISCKNEPLVPLREHVLGHLKEFSDTVTPKPVLLRCKQPELLKNTLEEHIIPKARKCKNRGKASHTGRSTGLSGHGGVNLTQLDDTNGIGDVLYVNTLSSQRETSPSLLEKQRQVLGNLISEIGSTQTVINPENNAAVVREENDGTPAVPRSSVVDDGEDEILIVDEMSQCPSSTTSIVSSVVHAVNQGDDDCMMLDVIELPAGGVSPVVADTRAKKFRCSMCSETFLRESTCRYHEQNSHRNDVGSDLCNEIYGVPLSEDSTIYLCQQCVVAFEDPLRARRHLAVHMVKGPAFPCEKCSGICLTESNLREHQTKHESGKLSYRCLKCTPNTKYLDETAIYTHLFVEHKVPLIAFCKNCLVGSANMDKIFSHVINRECSGGKRSNLTFSVPLLLRSLGFTVASELYFQPNDETKLKQLVTSKERFAIPTQCSHRSFITFGDSFTTCPDDPARCCGLVNHHRWHSYLCVINREAPGELPSVLPEAIIKNVGNESIIDILYSRFQINERNSQTLVGSCNVSNSYSFARNTSELASTSQSLVNTQQRNIAPYNGTSRPVHGYFMQSAPMQGISVPLLNGSQQISDGRSACDVPIIRRSLSNMSFTHSQPQAVCIFCRCGNVPMIFESADRSYEAVNQLCMKFRDVHPIAAQTLFSSLNTFIRDVSTRRSGNCYFYFCRWHYLPQCFDLSGRLISSILPSQFNAQILIDNHNKGLFCPDPRCIAVPDPMPLSTSVLHCGLSTTPLHREHIAPIVMQRCIVCEKIPSSGSCNAMNVDYMLAIPVSPPAVKEQWAKSICQYLESPISHELLNAFRMQSHLRICLKHFNPRSVNIDSTGKIARSITAINELPVLDFPSLAALSDEFCHAFDKLLDAMETNHNPNTIGLMLRIVQELVKCSDDKCGRMMNSITDICLHRFHQLQHKFVCMQCFNTCNVISNEQEMIEHIVLNHVRRSPEEEKVSAIYNLHCPLKNCETVYSSIQAFRKHINHAHNKIFPFASDNCATRFRSADKMSFHNDLHEKLRCDVTCCYLCGIVSPWRCEIADRVGISHELVHAVRRFAVCKTCMAPTGQDLNETVLVDHFVKQHMVNQPKRVRHCKVCRQNIVEAGLSEHILKQHKLIVFRACFTPQSNQLTIMTGREFCAYLGIPPEACKLDSLVDPSGIG